MALFFSRLGLLANGQFIDNDAQQRAVMLLYYMATGNHAGTENDVCLNKILCGLSPGDKVAHGIKLSGHEVEMVDELFKAVIHEWDKIKNSTVDGFRSSFLKREATLTLVDDAWRLKVEQRGYDVLLQTLPWNIGMIKTSWMKQILYVEWQ